MLRLKVSSQPHSEAETPARGPSDHGLDFDAGLLKPPPHLL